jgi:hypothetical protein
MQDLRLERNQRMKEIEEEAVEDFGHRPRKPGLWEEDQFPKNED